MLSDTDNQPPDPEEKQKGQEAVISNFLGVLGPISDKR